MRERQREKPTAPRIQIDVFFNDHTVTFGGYPAQSTPWKMRKLVRKDEWATKGGTGQVRKVA